jgi:hypothetical protein
MENYDHHVGYWTSNEADTMQAYFYDFGTFQMIRGDKTNSYLLRCVRRW